MGVIIMKKNKLIITISLILIIILGVILSISIRNYIISKKFKEILKELWSSNNIYYSQTNLETGEIEQIYYTTDIDVTIYNKKKKEYRTNNQRVVINLETNEILSSELFTTETTIKDMKTNEILETYEEIIPRIPNMIGNASQLIWSYLYDHTINKELNICSIKTGEFNKHQCYILISKNMEEIYIDKKTYFPIGVKNIDNITYVLELKFDVVTEEDVTLPTF